MSLQPNSETLQCNSNITATEFKQSHPHETLRCACSVYNRNSGNVTRFATRQRSWATSRLLEKFPFRQETAKSGINAAFQRFGALRIPRLWMDVSLALQAGKLQLCETPSAEEAEPLTLLSPVRGYITPEFTHGQIGRLPSIENRFHNVRRKEGTLQDSADVALVKPTTSCDRPSVVEASIGQALPPVVSACNRPQQRRCWLLDDFAV